jgi:SNF2 family DNA or RNA helicase
MLHATDKMKQMGIEVFGANELKSFKFNINKPVISVNLKSDTDWFDIEIDVSFGNQKASLKELQKSFIKKTNYVTLGDGTLGILPEEWMKKFSGYFKAGEIKKNGIQMSNYQFGIIDELYNEMESKPNFLVDLFEKKKRLQNISQIEEVAIPKGVKAKLRDYQHHGLNWLAFLDKNQLAGCLADDMGLGKTLQTITFLQYLKSQKKKNPPSLIIAPTSLIFNWKNEIEKFCPTLKMLTFIGNNRTENKDNFDKYDIIISTYGSLLNDIEFLKDFQFHYVILDESQAIKNPNSKRYKSVRLLNSYNRVVLTGTPIENNTFDLYAQLNFLNPGLLGNMTHFKNTFSDAIDKEKNIDSSQLLSKIISPFVLRRTKEQVATELPEKTESIIFCEMEKEQRKVYEAFKNKYRDYLLNKIDENGVAKSQMYILEGLTKLRQICNATSMINDKEDYGNYSVKLETLIENIKEKTGNHKILVFSQFVKMLQIIKTRLDEEQIQYEYLDGQTSSREEKVDNFQNNTNVRVFLISLKAGGTGLNLTEADYVFIIDPWWNPAVENQAIDRCYRIGQTKKVMAYRMICRDTIEEKIVALQSKKKAVANSIISIDEEKKSFNVNEVKELFS